MKRLGKRRRDLAVVFNRGAGEVEDDQCQPGHLPKSSGGAAFGCADR